MSIQNYMSFSTKELRKYLCPKCGRQLYVKRKTKIVKKTDSDADYWYKRSEVDGYWPSKLFSLKVSYADYFCYNCDEHYLDGNIVKLSIKKRDKKSILPLKLEKIVNCPKCGFKMKKRLRKICTVASLDRFINNENRLLEKRSFYIIIPYHLCPNCGEEIYPESNC